MSRLDAEQDFSLLPSRFLLFGLLFYVLLETLASLIIQYVPTMQAYELWVLFGIRSLELLGFMLLIMQFRLFQVLGFGQVRHSDVRLFLKISTVCVVMVGLLYVMQPDWFAYVSIPSWLQGIGGLLLMVLIAPIVEEIIFRGLLYRMLREQWGITLSVAVSAVFFSLLHQGSLISPQLIGGIVFALAYEWSRSLWVPIALHIGANAAVYVLAVLVFAD